MLMGPGLLAGAVLWPAAGRLHPFRLLWRQAYFPCPPIGRAPHELPPIQGSCRAPEALCGHKIYPKTLHPGV
jgi:hypothetical protein